MKKSFALLFILLIALSLSACKESENTSIRGNNNDTKTDSSITDLQGDLATNSEPGNLSDTDEQRDAYFNTFENFEDSFTEIYKKDQNFEIRHSKDHVGDFYTVYDNNGNLLDKGYHGYRGSFDISKNKNLVTLEYGFGGTHVFPTYRIYDVEKGKVSRYFLGPVALHNNLIASFIIKGENSYLVVQDIFDVDKFYKEFAVEMDATYYLQMEDILFADNGKKVIIKHYKDDYESDIVKKSFSIY